MNGPEDSSRKTLDALRSGALAGTRELRIPGCGLREVPHEVFDLAETLEVLDLGGNRLTDLPPDFARLTRLKVLFGSHNPFVRLPPVLGACPALSQAGFRGCGMRDLPGEALPPKLRWLTLTGNALEFLPRALGERSALQKLMLAGNRLSDLPDSLAGAPNLELIRLAANRFARLPPWLFDLPALAWLAWAGNPLEVRTAGEAACVPWSSLRPGPLLGEGASGRVIRADWQDGAETKAVALKLFKGAMTSDGLPESEMRACLAAGPHSNLASGLGRLVDHPHGAEGLLMPLLPEDWRVLAGPPSLESCSRDVYAPGTRFGLGIALRIACGIGAAAAHLHAHGIVHGDLYAHNVLWDGAAGDAVLSDFGAASFLSAGLDRAGAERLEVLAWGRLLGELLDRCDADPAALAEARAVQAACVQPNVTARPGLAEAVAALSDCERAHLQRKGESRIPDASRSEGR